MGYRWKVFNEIYIGKKDDKMSYIKGIDISNNNGSIDFKAVAVDGVGIVYLKASEGTTMQDSTLASFYTEAKAQGLKVGAYHFLVGTSEPETQAANFYAQIKDYDWDCVPMMDVETNFTGLADYVIRFIAAFNALSPLTLGIYSYTSFIEYLADAEATIKDMPFWEANYDNDPWNLPTNTIFTNRVGHQYTETGSISGVSEGCDVDSFTEGIYSDATTSTAGAWTETNNKWWYKHTDGTYSKSAWEKIDGKWYYFDSEGYMAYDWKEDGNNWYLLGHADDGAMKTGWNKTGGKWYYFDLTTGAMQTGWLKIDGEWYYLGTDGAMKTGWISDGGKDYCCYSYGAMISNCDLYGYRFDTNGVATKIS